MQFYSETAFKPENDFEVIKNLTTFFVKNY